MTDLKGRLIDLAEKAGRDLRLIHARIDGALITAEKGNLADAINEIALAGGGGGVATFNTRSGAVTLLSADVTAALAFTPTSVTGLTGAQSVAAFKTGLSLAKSDVGLGSVDNTSDASKPISTATQTALDVKQAADPQLSDVAALAYAGNALKAIRVNAGETGLELATVGGGAPAYSDITGVPTDTFLGRDTAGTGNAEAMSVATAKGLLSLTGTNSGDQTITLSGDVAGSGTGAITATIGANKVVDGMIRQSAGLSVIGRSANSTGNAADITGVANGVLRVSGATLAFGAVDLATAMVTGDLAFANLAQGAALSVLGVTGNATADVGSIAAGTDGHVLRRSGTALAFGTVATAGIGDDQVTYQKIQGVSATDRLLGRSTAGAGDIEEITCTAAGRALLDDASAADQRATLALGTASTKNIHIATTAPSSPAVNDLWVDTT